MDTSATDTIIGSHTPQKPLHTTCRIGRRMRPIRSARIVAGALASNMPLATLEGAPRTPSSLSIYGLVEFRAGYCVRKLAPATLTPTTRHTAVTRRLQRGNAIAINEARTQATAIDRATQRHAVCTSAIGRSCHSTSMLPVRVAISKSAAAAPRESQMPSRHSSTRPAGVFQRSSILDSHTAGTRWQSTTPAVAPTRRVRANCQGLPPGQAGSTLSIQHGSERNRAASSATVRRSSTRDWSSKLLGPEVRLESSRHAVLCNLPRLYIRGTGWPPQAPTADR